MSEWKPNYRTKPGVEVNAEYNGCNWRVKVATESNKKPLGGIFVEAEFAALFEPFPPEPMVTIPLNVAKLLDGHLVNPALGKKCQCTAHEWLAEAIAAAEPPKPHTVTVDGATLRNVLSCFEQLKPPDKLLGYAELAKAAGMEGA